MASKAPSSGLPAVFDGHNDTLLRLYLADNDVEPFFLGRDGHIDLPRARAGGFGGGFFAVFVPSQGDQAILDLVGDSSSTSSMASAKADLKPRKRQPWSRDNAPYSPPVSLEHSVLVAEAVINLAERLVHRSNGQVLWMKSLDDLHAAEQAFADDRFTQPIGARAPTTSSEPLRLVLHFEGAEPIAPDLGNLEGWYERGLRSLGLVWSRRNDFAAGVPFRYPSTPDHFDGLTPSGFDLVRACDDLGILLDLAHLNEKGFWDVSRTSQRPLIVTHAGVLSVCPSSRNLSDDQIKAVADSDGVIGVNLHCGDLRPDGRLNSDTPMAIVAQHIDAIVELAGPRHVALGSDFDGALMPRCLADAAALPKLLAFLVERGWQEHDLRAFAYGNWMRALRTAWTR